VVRSWLLDLTSDALEKNRPCTGSPPMWRDSGEGRWTVAEAIELGVPASVITLSLLDACVPATPIRLPTNYCRPCATNSAATRSK